MKIKVGPLKYKVVYVKNLRSGNDAELFGKIRHGPCEICEIWPCLPATTTDHLA